MSLRIASLLAVSAFLGSSCLSPRPPEVRPPEHVLAGLLDDLETVRGGSFDREGARPTEADVQREQFLVSKVRQLALRHPRHVVVLTANAALSYDAGDPIDAQRYVDQALSYQPDHVPAILLRVRIAAEAGNLPFARRVVTEQLALTPDDADLREALSGVLYLEGDHDGALRQLEYVDRLREGGLGKWRTDYHRGLIAEAQGELVTAREAFRRSHEANPSFAPALSRWRWLREGGGLDEAAESPAETRP